MKVDIQELSRPMRVTIIEDSENIKKKKKEIYNSVKNALPEIKGFRKGNIPQNVAEEKFGVEKLYKKLLDDLIITTMKEKKLITTRDIQIYGDLKDGKPLKIEFTAEVVPEVKLPEFDNIDAKFEESIEPTKDEIDKMIDNALKEKEKLEDVEHQNLKNLDTVIIDYEGIIENEKESFKGGSAKNFQLAVNTEKKTFIDNFEEQIIGMEKGQTKDINVIFPEDYRDKTKAGKRANFKVKLHSIKKKVLPDLNNEFAKQKGFENVNEYEEFIKERIRTNKKNSNSDNFKKNIIAQFLLKTEFSPIPVDMVKQEVERQWVSFLRRIGKTEEEFLKEKENKNAKEDFITNNKESAKQTLKTTLILDAIAKKVDLVVTKDDVMTYTTNLIKILNYDETRKNKVLKDLENNPAQYRLQEKATLNEKTLDYLVDNLK